MLCSNPANLFMRLTAKEIMKRKSFIIAIPVMLFFSALLPAQQTISASKARGPIVVDGKSTEASWDATEARTLDYFYHTEKATDSQKTVFRMLWDDQALYLFFECEDQFITARETARDGEPYLDDCAEIFLIPVPVSRPVHFGFEVNLYKASNDFIAFTDFYEGKGGVLKSYNPDFDVEVSIDGTVNDNADLDRGWTMEMAIPLSLFANVSAFTPVSEGNKWTLMVIRQERNDAEAGRRVTSTLFPLSDPPRVHESSRFGQVVFVR